MLGCALVEHGRAAHHLCIDGALTAHTFGNKAKARVALNPARWLITGVVCGVRVEEIEDPPMREIRYLDKLIDELAKGKAMGRIFRG
jgi:hypothetical protein